MQVPTRKQVNDAKLERSRTFRFRPGRGSRLGHTASALTPARQGGACMPRVCPSDATECDAGADAHISDSVVMIESDRGRRFPGWAGRRLTDDEHADSAGVSDAFADAHRSSSRVDLRLTHACRRPGVLISPPHPAVSFISMGLLPRWVGDINIGEGECTPGRDCATAPGRMTLGKLKARQSHMASGSRPAVLIN